MRRTMVVPLVLLCVASGCARRGDSNARRVRGPQPRAAAAGTGPESVEVAAARRLAMSKSTGLAGSPGGMATDRAGTVVAVDDDSVVALDQDGDEQWSTRVAGAGLGWPALGDGLVVVPTLRDDGGPGGCVALDRSTGSRVWAYEEPDSQGVAVALAGPRVVCALSNGVVVAVDRATGQRLWRIVFAPRAARSVVSIAERGALAVDDATSRVVFTVRVGPTWLVATVDVGTGAERGEFDLTTVGPVSAPVSISPGMLAVGVSGSREVCALDLRRGRVGTCVRAPVPDGFDPASVPLFVSGLVVIAGRDGSVSAIDLASKKVRWSVRTPNPILDARPVVVGGVVMFSDWTRVPWAVRLSDGARIAVPKFDGWVVSTVADAAGGFEVAERNMDGGWIERWVPVA